MVDEVSAKDELLERIAAGRASIGVVGLGYVGLPLMLRFAERGFATVGFDNDPAKIELLRSGKSYIAQIDDARIHNALATGLAVTSDLDRVSELDAIVLCLPTPLGPHREPDLSYVLGTVETIVPHLRRGQVVSLESTTYPGTTDEELRPRMESRGLKVGRDVFLVFSPEREDPGNRQYSIENIPKICGGCTADCRDVGVALYSMIVDEVVPVSSARTAELAKLLENIHRAVNIGLVNEMKIVADRMGIDIYEVIRAASTKPFGFVPYQPGPGLGGHCIPIDPFYLTWKAREYGVETRFIELAGEVNSAMPDYVVGKLALALNARKRSVSGARILVLGVAYKKNVGDTRESPALEIMEKLQELGAEVAYSDPHVPALGRMRRFDFGLESTPLNEDALKAFDCVLIATDHDDFDYELIRRRSPLVIDARGRYAETDDHIWRA